MEKKGKVIKTKVIIEKEEYEGYPEEHKHIPSSSGTSSGIKELALRSTKFYADKIEMSSAYQLKSRDVYERLGQYAYKTDYAEDFGECIGANKDGCKWIYVGQFKKDSETRHGIGIQVWDTGDIYEGEYKDGNKHGRGRYIYSNGASYEGEYKDGNRHGQGVYVYPSGNKAVGEWKEDYEEGKHTKQYPKGRSAIINYS
uniref:Uncharacterized protein n=1 Tax=Euplotes harpa TaxID=151035 RepID=A0A7S3J447_9SPIT